jgi:hypothetical protein
VELIKVYFVLLSLQTMQCSVKLLLFLFCLLKVALFRPQRTRSIVARWSTHFKFYIFLSYPLCLLMSFSGLCPARGGLLNPWSICLLGYLAAGQEKERPLARPPTCSKGRTKAFAAFMAPRNAGRHPRRPAKTMTAVNMEIRRDGWNTAAGLTGVGRLLAFAERFHAFSRAVFISAVYRARGICQL